MNNTLVITTASDGNSYEIYLKGANIVRIVRNHSLFETPYDDLPLHIREELLIAIIGELATPKD